jgi:hypothetical protein
MPPERNSCFDGLEPGTAGMTCTETVGGWDGMGFVGWVALVVWRKWRDEAEIVEPPRAASHSRAAVGDAVAVRWDLGIAKVRNFACGEPRHRAAPREAPLGDSVTGNRG